MKLINELIALQKLERLSDEKFGKKLGVSRMTWLRIKAEKVSLKVDFLRTVIAVYPGLKKEVEKILS